MPAFFTLSTSSDGKEEGFLEDLFWGGVFSQNHGTDFSGIAVSDNGKLVSASLKGLFRSNFEAQMKGFCGKEGLVYCGDFREPFSRKSAFGEFSISMVGKICNQEKMVQDLKSSGYSFEREDAAELLATIFVQESTPKEGVKRILRELQGAFIGAIIIPNQGIYVFRSPSGRWPLTLGEKKGATVAAFDSSGFSNLGFTIKREVEAGEIILMRNGKIEGSCRVVIPGIHCKICVFLWVYFLFPTAVLMGVPVTLVRKRLGRALAASDISSGFVPDIVSYIPRSGFLCAIGYFQEYLEQIRQGKLSKIPDFEPLLFRHDHAFKSFIMGNSLKRGEEALHKISSSPEKFKGQEAVFCEDSFVRGTIGRNIATYRIPELGLKEPHYRSSFPVIYEHCTWCNTTRREELLTYKVAIGQFAEYLKVKSFKSNTISELLDAVGLPAETLCLDCVLPHS